MVTEMIADGVKYLQDKKDEVDRLLDLYLPAETEYPEILHKAMRYSVLAGGKRIRPVLCMTVYEAFGGTNRDIINPAACSLEMVHTYSLIHDDLPCMDDDDLRRGQKTLHREYTEAIAVLAGDALHDLAFYLLAQSGNAEVVRELATAIGTYGMLGGQMADIEAEKKQISLNEIKYIHIHKTAALIRGSIRIGGILAGVKPDILESLTMYGEKIGFAFQIVDDILDVEGDQSKLGKEVGSDSKNQKATYPDTVGMEQARTDARQLIDEAVAISQNFDLKDNYFEFIARYIGNRDR